jgi:Na+/H+-dicarboxylate symporter
MSKKAGGRRRLGLSSAILIGLGLGLAAGIVFGELCAGLKVIGDAFIALLQMTVLPYVMFALIANIGGLTWTDARRLAARGGLLLLIFWAITLGLIVLMPLTFPTLETASFFSTSLVEPPPRRDLLGLYIPANPFHALANSVIPAVVLFSIALGAALMSVPRKEGVIELFSVFTAALMRVNRFVVRLAPLGVFALTASAAGTLTLEEFSRLQAYLITYVLAALLLTFLIFPALAAAFTPFTYRQILRCARDPLVTGFTTGSLFVILPMLTERITALFEEQGLRDQEIPQVDVLLPVAFSFPTAGKLLSLLFLPFAAWFNGPVRRPAPLGPAQLLRQHEHGPAVPARRDEAALGSLPAVRDRPGLLRAVRDADLGHVPARLHGPDHVRPDRRAAIPAGTDRGPARARGGPDPRRRRLGPRLPRLVAPRHL